MTGGTIIKKPHLANVTCIVADCTDKLHLAERAIEKSLEQVTFGAVKFLTHDASRKWAVQIPKLNSIEDYSRFCIRDLHRYVDTSHCLVMQSDGYLLNGNAWTDAFLKYDYIGSPWESWGGKVGNGGWSLRSKKLLNLCASMAPNESGHPEDAFICHAYRSAFEVLGVRFAPTTLARQFGVEGRAFVGAEWNGTPNSYVNSLGFHSYLTKLPDHIDRPLVYHSSGDAGDIVYSLAVVKALGGGVFFTSPDCRYPFPKKPKACALEPAVFSANIAPLIRRQPYIWQCLSTGSTPFSTDVNFDQFRLAYQRGGNENWKSLLELHAQPFGVEVDGSEPWLECNEPIEILDHPIIVNRTSRYQNHAFPWWQMIRKYGHLMAFVGSEQEHSAFQGHAPDIKIAHAPTSNLWEAAQIIAGAKVCMMNQSACLAIAHGLGKRVLIEEWKENPNCHIVRDGAIYFRHNEAIDVPESWLT